MTFRHIRPIAALLLASSALIGPALAAPIETVVVTAQKREENVQRVPVTVTVVDAKQMDLKNVTTTYDLVRAVPAVSSSDEGVYQIRSIGTQGFGRSAEQSVSVVLDGVVLGRALTNAMYDLERIEVLSGPQGTLFGKNATAGVINIVTHKPVLGEYGAFGHIDYGDHQYIHSYVVGNLPLGDDAALRISFHHDTTGHIVFNTIYDQWDFNFDNGVRARLLWEPTPDLTINVSGDYQKLGANGINGVADFAGVQVYAFAPPGSPLETRLAACGVVASPKNNRVCQDSVRPPGVDVGDTYGRWNAGGAIQIDYRWGGYTLTSITALRQTVNEDFKVHDTVAGEFADTLPINILDRNLVPYFARTWSQELRVASPADEPFNFVAGLYYAKTDSHDQIDQSGQFAIPLGPLQFRRFIDMFIHQQNYAAFGQVNIQASDQLTFILGARITHDDNSDFSFNSFPPGPFIYTGNTGFFSVFPVNSCTIAGGNPYIVGGRPCPAGTSITTPGTLRKTGASGTFGLRYQYDDDTMFFATISRGYKGPFMNESASFPLVLPDDLVIDPEYPTDIDLGMKTTVWDRFAFNVSLFTNKIDGFQTTIYVPPGPGRIVANFIQGNAGFAISRGVEASFVGPVDDNLSLNLTAIYNDAHFDDAFRVNCGAAGPCPAVHQLPYAPELKASLAADYRHQLFDTVDGFLQGDLAWSSSYPYSSTPGIPVSPPRYYLGARAGLRDTDEGHWQVAVFCRNCLDKRYPIHLSPDGFAALDGGNFGGQSSRYQFLTIDSYRVLGLTLDLKY